MVDVPKPRGYRMMSNKPDFPAIEERILAFWKQDSTFEDSVELRPAGEEGSNEFVFYDGPPFANGLPHYGHLLTGYVKDIIPRYQTMRGHRVERRFGWDCHGLPAELATEKDLGISGGLGILDYGLEKFNDHCRVSVLRYAAEWERTVTRQARWVDFENDYKTMDVDFMESVIWAFKELWRKGLIYQDVRVLPYSWAAETPVSNFETQMDNAYRERVDPAVTVAFSLAQVPDDRLPLRMLVWTTTPWTLPSNLALAVGEDIAYQVFEEDGVGYVIGADAASKFERELVNATLVGTIFGRDLVGRRYEPLFPFFADTPDAFRILAGDFVSTSEGTGTVHIAPGFGEDDFRLGREAGLPAICPVDQRGQFTSDVPPYEGLLVFDANKPIIAELKRLGVLIRREEYRHSYPHCWRTDEPLIYRTVDSWFVKVTDFRERMVELNQQISWTPEHVRDGLFGNWLANARDWSISRNRYWGAPIPVWRSDNPAYPRVDVYGSLDEIEHDFGVRPDNLHRPFIDELTRPNPDDPTGRSTMRRVQEVFDCWFESGSMPFAQVHYPFENKEWLKNHLPADFIVEYMAQTRGWFYTLMVLSTALFDRPPFKNCICHGVVLDENQQKLSKRLRNYPSPESVFETSGADALRWYLTSSALLRGGNLSIDREGSEIARAARQVMLPLWNAAYFFTTYANADGIRAEFDTSSSDLLDRYILSKTRGLVDNLTASLDSFDIPGACAQATVFMDVLNNWYIRRARDRFWSESNAEAPQIEKSQAYNTLYTVLLTVLRALAPLLPMVTEELYRNLTGERSVHLVAWPDAATFPFDEVLVADMDLVRDICSAAKNVRETHRLRNRLPLRECTIAGKHVERLGPFFALISDEINVKNVRIAVDLTDVASESLQLNLQALGPRLGPAMPKVSASARAGEWESVDETSVVVAGVTLGEGDFEINLVPREGLAGSATPGNRAMVVLDVNVTPELEAEGLARDAVRSIQEYRKSLGLNVSDRIEITYRADSQRLTDALATHAAFVSSQVLATKLEETDAAALDGSECVSVGKESLILRVALADVAAE